MASQRKKAEGYGSPALDWDVAERLSREQLLAALKSMATRDFLDIHGANTVLYELVSSTRIKALHASQVELSSDELDTYLTEFKPRFSVFKSILKHDETFEEVKKALRASPEALKTLIKLDAAGFEMNVFKSKKTDYLQFRMAQLDVGKIDPKYHDLKYDKQASETYPPKYQLGNAMDTAKALGCEIADEELYEQLRVIKGGWLLLKTDDQKRESGFVLRGHRYGTDEIVATYSSLFGSFAAALCVKKAKF